MLISFNKLQFQSFLSFQKLSIRAFFCIFCFHVCFKLAAVPNAWILINFITQLLYPTKVSFRDLISEENPYSPYESHFPPGAGVSSQTGYYWKNKTPIDRTQTESDKRSWNIKWQTRKRVMSRVWFQVSCLCTRTCHLNRCQKPGPSTKALFTQASSTKANLPSIDHRLELDWIKLWLMEALYLYVWKLHPIP